MTVSIDFPPDERSWLQPEPEALRKVPARLALDHDVLALAWDGDELAVAVPDAADAETVDRLRLETGSRVRAISAPRELIRKRLSAAYGSVSVPHGNEREDSPVAAFLDDVVERAVASDASDIHFEPSFGEARIRLRVHGAMRVARPVPIDLFERAVARLKLLAQMDVADRRQPQDGRCTFACGGRSIEARVASLPTTSGEKVVVRLLEGDAHTSSLEHLGMDAETARDFRDAISAPYGCVLVAGPTGSGKTTTLYAGLATLDTGDLNICTIEDPVERRVSGVTQVQISDRAGLTFAAALRSIVRQDPDVIMLGEIRDAQTAAAAASAGLAGHLVLSSIHAGDGAGALERLVDLGVSRRSLGATVRAVISQRLLRRCDSSGRAQRRIAAFDVARVDGRGRIAEAQRGGLSRSVAALVARGVVAAAEARRVLGEDAL